MRRDQTVKDAPNEDDFKLVKVTISKRRKGKHERYIKFQTHTIPTVSPISHKTTKSEWDRPCFTKTYIISMHILHPTLVPFIYILFDSQHTNPVAICCHTWLALEMQDCYIKHNKAITTRIYLWGFASCLVAKQVVPGVMTLVDDVCQEGKHMARRTLRTWRETLGKDFTKIRTLSFVCFIDIYFPSVYMREVWSSQEIVEVERAIGRVKVVSCTMRHTQRIIVETRAMRRSILLRSKQATVLKTMACSVGSKESREMGENKGQHCAVWFI